MYKIDYIKLILLGLKATFLELWLVIDFLFFVPQTQPTISHTSFKGAVQLWNLGHMGNGHVGDEGPGSTPPSPPRLGVVIAHEYGCVRVMRWCHHHLKGPFPPSDDQPKDRQSLGILSLACSDGCIRILS